jgi:hypothetical protein
MMPVGCSDVETSLNTLAALQREWESPIQPLKKPTDKSAAYPYRLCQPLH